MNLKNPRARYWVAGLVVLLVGIAVLGFLHFSHEPVITGNVATEEWPKVRAAVRRFRVQKVMGALRTWKCRKVPALAADCVAGPVVQARHLGADEFLVVTRGKKIEISYLLRKWGGSWSVIGEQERSPIFPPVPPGLNPNDPSRMQF
jgi:hypothetical protein